MSSANKSAKATTSSIVSDEHRTRTTVACEAAVHAFSDHLQQAEVMQRITPVLYDTGKSYWIWSSKESCYVQADETDILNAVKTATGDRLVVTDKVKREIIQALQLTGRDRWSTIKEVPETWIQFKDCVYDVSNDNVTEATQDYFFTTPIPHNLGNTDDVPVVDKLFSEWAGEEHKQILYEIIGYSMYNGYPIHRVFAFFGSGRNGKGQYMNLLKNLSGNYNTCSTSLERLAMSRFAATKLHRKNVAFISETNFTTLKNTAQLKALSGGDTIPGEYKHGKEFDFVNTAKIIVATNSLPETVDKTRGFYARWIIIRFEN